MEIRTLFQTIHKRLIPADEPMPFAPYIWLVYLCIFIVSLYFYQGKENYLWQAIVAMVVFLTTYFHAYHARGVILLFDIAVITLIGTWMSLITPGASVFFVYAAAFVCRVNNVRFAFSLLLSILGYIAFVSWIFNFHAFFYIPAMLFSLMIGGLNIFQHEMEKKKKQIQLSQQEVKTLAASAERERIARDLHDVIGHTFSLLTRKAELANRLMNKNTEAAAVQVQEIETISRDALNQVREVISGYRSSDIVTELAHAKYVLESNDINFEYRLNIDTIAEELSQEFAIIIKELVTNVLKHADATKVIADIQQTTNNYEIHFADNGQGTKLAESTEGFGLQGIRERLEPLKGSVSFTGIQQKSNIEDTNEEVDTFSADISSLNGFSALIKVPTND